MKELEVHLVISLSIYVWYECVLFCLNIYFSDTVLVVTVISRDE